jgi:hypothetical protein
VAGHPIQLVDGYLMSIRAKPFQQATIEAALRTLVRPGPRRYLVADEVGLGKTIIASGVIQKMAAGRRKRPLCVLYVCSNLAIARQNMDGLLSFLGEKESDKAIGTIDRPSLLPTRKMPTHPRVRVFQLTPDTAIPTRKGQRRDGRMEERALALVLIRQIAPTVNAQGLFRAFKRNAGDSFMSRVTHYRGVAGERNGLGGAEFRGKFRDALREVLSVAKGGQLPPRLNQFLQERRYQDLVAAARTALAIAALRDIAPDLVILDEFQRFRDLTDERDGMCAERDGCDNADTRDQAAVRVMDAIRGAAGRNGPALLLLSATPYTPYRSPQDRRVLGSGEDNHSSDFFGLVSFLAADSTVADQAKQLFALLRDELKKGAIGSERAVAVRGALTQLLTPLMSRTERTSIRLGSWDGHLSPTLIESKLLKSDMRQFQDMVECFSEKDRDWIVPLWQSVPLPMQSLGNRYAAWQRKKKMPALVELSKQDRDAYRKPSNWPHPRLRALMTTMAETSMAMPWSRPSLPWWPLAGGWRLNGSAADDGKLLVFSRFRAVPTSLSGLLSYTAEQRWVPGLGKAGADYEPVSSHWLKPSSALLELFHPSPLLASIDPLQAPIGRLAGMKAGMRRQLRERLAQLRVKVVSKRKGHRNSWELLPALELRAGLWEASSKAWQKVGRELGSDAGGLVDVVRKWDEAANRQCNEISALELDELVALAIEAPGVVLLRALLRHRPEAPTHMDDVVSTAWNGLRNYLNRPLFVSVLTSGKAIRYPKAIRVAVIEGGFESVLDEHFWYLSQGPAKTFSELLGELRAVLRLHDPSVTFHEPADTAGSGECDQAFRIRCHVAIPLTEGRIHGNGDSSLDGPLRPDEVRRAFNSPFWPKVLVTTSIGQEGLDLHPWCNSLAHWDLATGPVALEQREGRITRFAGLSVRRAIANRMQSRVNVNGGIASPWKQLAHLAESELGDDSGLAPWWSVDGATYKSYVFSAASSEQRIGLEALNQERALYRLVLGMPDQNDLMGVLKIKLEQGDETDIRAACLDLCAYNRDRS